MATNHPKQKMFRVVEVPVGATAEQIEDALNNAVDDGYYFLHYLPAETAGYRALFRLRTRHERDQYSCATPEQR
jgi:hypothetical protein